MDLIRKVIPQLMAAELVGVQPMNFKGLSDFIPSLYSPNNEVRNSMLSLRQQSVNVDRHQLIQALRDGLETHKVEYVEAIKDYEKAVVKFLEEATERAKRRNFNDLVLRLQKPENHEKDYTNVIELLEVSVDETIQLDADSFRAYYKGEWGWKASFGLAASSLKSYLAS